MIRPMPTMPRKAKNGMITGGQSGREGVEAKLARRPIAAVDEAAQLGNRDRQQIPFLDGSGMAISTSLAGCWVFQRASMAANLAGW